VAEISLITSSPDGFSSSTRRAQSCRTLLTRSQNTQSSRTKMVMSPICLFTRCGDLVTTALKNKGKASKVRPSLCRNGQRPGLVELCSATPRAHLLSDAGFDVAMMREPARILLCALVKRQRAAAAERPTPWELYALYTDGRGGSGKTLHKMLMTKVIRNHQALLNNPVDRSFTT